MKQSSDFERFCSFDAFYDASYKVCRNVRWKDSTTNFEEERLETILKTEEDLRMNEYIQLIFSCFMVIERGKPREIRACHIDDRLVQNALCDQVLIPELVPKFIYDNCATLRNRGIDFALKRAKKHLQEAHREYGLGNSFYTLRIDIRKYFDSIDHKSLKKIARKNIKDNRIYELVCYLIDTFAFKITHDKIPIKGKNYYVTKGNRRYVKVNVQQFKKGTQYYEYSPKSLGLGSQTSQLFALLALNEVDHFIKEKLCIKYYGRYMDDLYLIHNDHKYLLECKKQIGQKLNEVHLIMNNKKTTIVKIQPVEPKEDKKHAPFKYLKWNFFLTTNNKIIQIPFKEKLAKERVKLRKMHAGWKNGTITIEAISEHYQGWRANMLKGTTFYIVQNMDNYFRSLFKGVEIK